MCFITRLMTIRPARAACSLALLTHLAEGGNAEHLGEIAPVWPNYGPSLGAVHLP